MAAQHADWFLWMTWSFGSLVNSLGINSLTEFTYFLYSRIGYLHSFHVLAWKLLRWLPGLSTDAGNQPIKLQFCWRNWTKKKTHEANMATVSCCLWEQISKLEKLSKIWYKLQIYIVFLVWCFVAIFPNSVGIPTLGFKTINHLRSIVYQIIIRLRLVLILR